MKQFVITICIFIAMYNRMEAQSAPQTNSSHGKKLYHQKNVNDILQQIEVNGDTVAYLTLYSDLSLLVRSEEMLRYCLIMANKFGFTRANRHVFEILLCKRGCFNLKQKVEALDPFTRKLACYYLIRAYELRTGDVAESMLIEIYGSRANIPKSKDVMCK